MEIRHNVPTVAYNPRKFNCVWSVSVNRGANTAYAGWKISVRVLGYSKISQGVNQNPQFSQQRLEQLSADSRSLDAVCRISFLTTVVRFFQRKSATPSRHFCLAMLGPSQKCLRESLEIIHGKPLGELSTCLHHGRGRQARKVALII